MKFWLDKGVDGFRVDAVNHLFEVEDLRDEPLSGKTNDPLNYDYTVHDYTHDLDETYDMVKQWRSILNEYNDRIMMMEVWTNISKTMEYYDAGASFPFNFGLIALLKNDSTAQNFKNFVDTWMSNMPEGATANWVVSISCLYFLMKPFIVEKIK